MKKIHILAVVFLIALLSKGCFKDIDTVPLPQPEVEDYFVVENSIKKIQSFFRFYENTVIEEDTSVNTKWDLAFESAGVGSRILLGWATFSTTIPSGIFDFSQLNQDLILALIDSSGWVYDDPSFVNTYDSLALTGHWENGEIYIQNRGVTNDNYYAIQYVAADEDSYTFKYASAQALDEVHEATIQRSSAFNYVYYSYSTHGKVAVEPDFRLWDILFTPYRGWWETSEPGVYAPFNMSGIMINNEAGVRVAHIFDPDVLFEDLDSASVYLYEFTDKKGAIGADWKVLGDQNSGNIISVNPDKKYLLKKYNSESGKIMYFKLQIIDYKNDSGEAHHPTVEFKFLFSE